MPNPISAVGIGLLFFIGLHLYLYSQHSYTTYSIRFGHKSNSQKTQNGSGRRRGQNQIQAKKCGRVTGRLLPDAVLDNPGDSAKCAFQLRKKRITYIKKGHYLQNKATLKKTAVISIMTGLIEAALEELIYDSLPQKKQLAYLHQSIYN
jgi:hypothetical protein